MMFKDVFDMFDDGMFHVTNSVWSPDSRIQEGLIFVDLPGVISKDININIEKELLVIDGIRKVNKDYTRKFSKSFVISKNIDTEKITASLKDGVLSLVLPRSKSSLPKKIKIKVE